MDNRLRSIERYQRDDRETLLREKLRAGQLDYARLELSAKSGDKDACKILDVKPLRGFRALAELLWKTHKEELVKRTRNCLLSRPKSGHTNRSKEFWIRFFPNPSSFSFFIELTGYNKKLRSNAGWDDLFLAIQKIGRLD